LSKTQKPERTTIRRRVNPAYGDQLHMTKLVTENRSEVNSKRHKDDFCHI